MAPKLRAYQPRVVPTDTRRLKPPPKLPDPELNTAAWRAWRDAVIKRAGGVCQSKGCFRSEKRMFADHIIERRDGGALYDIANGQCLCGSCHTTKTLQARVNRLRKEYSVA